MIRDKFMSVKIEESWKKVLKDEFEKDYFKSLSDFVRSEIKTKTVYPKPENIFKAFELCPFDDLRVVILGQDPYHGPGQAHGLCFSVKQGVQNPPSLKNIFKEIESDLSIEMSDKGNLSAWAEQGVFLLNATLTVLDSQAGSHQGKGWEEFTDAVIKNISSKKDHVVFILWGAYAQSKTDLIDTSKHLILKAPHPSPLSAHRGFFGSKHFSQTNNYLEAIGKEGIEWKI